MSIGADCSALDTVHEIVLVMEGLSDMVSREPVVGIELTLLYWSAQLELLGRPGD